MAQAEGSRCAKWRLHAGLAGACSPRPIAIAPAAIQSILAYDATAVARAFGTLAAPPLPASQAHTGNVNQGPFILLGIWGESFNGLIADVRLWSIARNAAAIQADMSHDLAGNEPGLVGYWPLDEGTGQIAVDRTSGHADGRLGSTTQSDDQDPAWVISDRPVQ